MKTITTTAEPLGETITVAFNPLALATSKTEALEQLNELQSATIDNDVELAEGVDLLRNVVAERKVIEGMLDHVLAPLQESIKRFKALFAPVLQTKEASELKLRTLVGEYQAAKAAEQRRLMAAAAEAAQSRKPAELSKALVAASASAPSRTVGVTVKEVWRAEVKAPDLVPYDWCVPDEKRINAHARTTPIDKEPSPIPGVIFKRVPSTTVR